jgi:hypothetical protein
MAIESTSVSGPLVPAMGYAGQRGPSSGWYTDGWVGSRFSAVFKATRRVSALVVRGWCPPFFRQGNQLRVAVGAQSVTAQVAEGMFELVLPLDWSEGDSCEVEIVSSSVSSGVARGESDPREVAFMLRDLEFASVATRPATRSAATPGPLPPPVHISELRRQAEEFAAVLHGKKSETEPKPNFWYPYGTMSNFPVLEQLLAQGAHGNLLQLSAGLAVADVGAADGDLAFFLDRVHGLKVHVIDHAATNYNGMRGVRLMKEALGSSVQIHDIDLDAMHELPEERFGLVFFLGILYHIKNPFFVLDSLSRRAKHLVLSTRVAQLSPDRGTNFAHLPVAYLLHASESNNDATNYWIFSPEGLKRILHRTGWDVLEFTTVGCTVGSDPAAPDRDERAFCLLKSRRV